MPLRSAAPFVSFDSAILAQLPRGSWAQRNSYPVSSTESFTNPYMIKKLRGWISELWLQGRLAPFPAPNRIFINPFMVKEIEQGRKGAPSHTSKFLSLQNSRVPQFLHVTTIRIYIYIFPQNIYAAKKSSPSFSFTCKDFLYSAWIVIFFATHVMLNIKSLQDGAPQ